MSKCTTMEKSKKEQFTWDIRRKDKAMNCAKWLTTPADEPKHHSRKAPKKTKMVIGMMWLHRGRITVLTHSEEQSFPTKKVAYNKHCIYTKKMEDRERERKLEQATWRLIIETKRKESLCLISELVIAFSILLSIPFLLLYYSVCIVSIVQVVEGL